MNGNITYSSLIT